jgi:hypothetical protein
MPYDAEESIKRMNETVSISLKKTFDLVAKTAMDGSSELQDPTLGPVERMRKAHSRVTLIVEDAMRGLADAHEVMYSEGIRFGVGMGAEYFGSAASDHEGDDLPS